MDKLEALPLLTMYVEKNAKYNQHGKDKRLCILNEIGSGTMVSCTCDVNAKWKMINHILNTDKLYKLFLQLNAITS